MHFTEKNLIIYFIRTVNCLIVLLEYIDLFLWSIDEHGGQYVCLGTYCVSWHESLLTDCLWSGNCHLTYVYHCVYLGCIIFVARFFCRDVCRYGWKHINATRSLWLDSSVLVCVAMAGNIQMWPGLQIQGMWAHKIWHDWVMTYYMTECNLCPHFLFLQALLQKRYFYTDS